MSYTLEIPHIYSVLPIGNDIEIQIRQVSQLNFISITRNSSNSIVTVLGELTETGTYEFVFESYDDLSPIKSALKTDSISLVIRNPE